MLIKIHIYIRFVINFIIKGELMKSFFKSRVRSYANYSILFLSMTLLAACGGGGNSTPPPNSTEPVLGSVGSKTIAVGGTLTFTVTATDPNNLQLILSKDGSVGSGLNPFTATGSLATFNTNTGRFSWNTTTVTEGDYFVQFSVMNTNAETDSEIVKISVQGQYALGEQKYNDDCQSCHGTGGIGGSQTLIQCIDSATFFEKINGGSMAQYASQWTTSDKNAVLFYLNNVNPAFCI